MAPSLWLGPSRLLGCSDHSQQSTWRPRSALQFRCNYKPCPFAIHRSKHLVKHLVCLASRDDDQIATAGDASRLDAGHAADQLPQPSYQRVFAPFVAKVCCIVLQDVQQDVLRCLLRCMHVPAILLLLAQQSVLQTMAAFSREYQLEDGSTLLIFPLNTAWIEPAAILLAECFQGALGVVQSYRCVGDLACACGIHTRTCYSLDECYQKCAACVWVARRIMHGQLYILNDTWHLHCTSLSQ